jgi:hypothetical protein
MGYCCCFIIMLHGRRSWGVSLNVHVEYAVWIWVESADLNLFAECWFSYTRFLFYILLDCIRLY